MPDIVKCRSCQADIMFVRSASTGNFMVIDATPRENGNVAIIDGAAHVLRGDLFEQMMPLGTARYVDHHATCPEAAKWRKGKDKKPKDKKA